MVAAQDVRFRAVIPAPTILAGRLIEPLSAVSVLFAMTLLTEPALDVPSLVLALLFVAAAFVGNPVPFETASASGAARPMMQRWLVIASALLFVGWVTGTLARFEPTVLAAVVAGVPLGQFLIWFAWRHLLGGVLERDAAQRTAVVAGANETGRLLAERLQSDALHGIRFAGFFDDRGRDRLPRATEPLVLGRLEELPEFVKHNRIDVIYCTLPMCSQPRIRKLIDGLRDTTASIYFAPDLTFLDLIQARIDAVGGIPVIAVCESPFQGLSSIAKRVSDLLIGGAILLMIMPLSLLIAVGIKLSSPGPVLFKQRRYGLDGREIEIYKFRTMTCMDDGDIVKQATQDDARVTRFGALLRRYSLDELPQFFNVLQGHMSVVGPRPHAVAHNEAYRKIIRGYMLRHKVKPGITGLAQIRGLRGETDTVDKMRARIDSDLEYLRSWSLLLDFKIVLRTALAVLSGRNAY